MSDAGWNALVRGQWPDPVPVSCAIIPTAVDPTQAPEGRDNLCENVKGIMGFHIDGFARELRAPEDVDDVDRFADPIDARLDAIEIETGRDANPYACSVS